MKTTSKTPAKIIDEQVTRKVADLVKIKLKDAEVTKITGQLNTVLDSVEVLNEIDTAKTPITAQTHNLTNVLAEDLAEPGLDMSKYQNKKNFNGKYFVVTKVL